jgi:hypothetical protein
MTFPIQPRVNGYYPSFAEVQISLGGYVGVPIPTPLVDIRAIDYKGGFLPQWLHIGGGYALGRTRGQYVASGSIEWGLETYNAVIDILSGAFAPGSPIPGSYGGYGDVPFTLTITYAPMISGGIFTTATDLQTDTLQQVRIIGDSNSASVGGKEITIHTELSIGRIIRDGSLLTAGTF